MTVRQAISVSSELSGKGQSYLGPAQTESSTSTCRELRTASVCFVFQDNVLRVAFFTPLKKMCKQFILETWAFMSFFWSTGGTIYIFFVTLSSQK